MNSHFREQRISFCCREEEGEEKRIYDSSFFRQKRRPSSKNRGLSCIFRTTKSDKKEQLFLSSALLHMCDKKLQKDYYWISTNKNNLIIRVDIKLKTFVTGDANKDGNKLLDDFSSKPEAIIRTTATTRSSETK